MATKKHFVLRDEVPPDDSIVVVRGGLLESSVIPRTTGNCHDAFGFFGLSVFAAIDVELGELCRSQEALLRPKKIRTTTFGDLKSAFFPVLPTFKRPHYSIVLADLEDGTIERLDRCFALPIENPANPDGG